jgi:D-alanyl-D-alanine dipeptidase
VIERLLLAQAHLQRQAADWRLAIFDGWRPLAVQRFMVEHTIAELCAARQLDRHQPAAASACAAASTDAGALLEHSADLDHSAAIEQVIADVGRFWATPSDDPATPPPHSTGAAVDLSLADAAGQPLAMGSPIDAIGAVSEPNHFAEVAAASSDSAERLQALEWHRRRQLLAAAKCGPGAVAVPRPTTAARFDGGRWQRSFFTVSTPLAIKLIVVEHHSRPVCCQRL